MQNQSTLPTAEQLRNEFQYDPVTGELRNRIRRNLRNHAGEIAGSINKHKGYRLVKYKGRSLKAHRVIWCIVTGSWPSDQIDHINGVPHDNRWANLREATNAQNRANTTKQCKNTSGFKGVSYKKANRKWVAQISHNGKRKHLGLFDSVEAAHDAYRDAACRLHGEFARY